jgi:hypothetical protein
MNPIATKSKKPTSGKLIWIDNATKSELIVRTGQFSLLQCIRKTLKQDPAYKKGYFKLTY